MSPEDHGDSDDPRQHLRELQRSILHTAALIAESAKMLRLAAERSLALLDSDAEKGA